MSDTNAYINTYIDNAMGMIHEQLKTILQLKTQVTIVNGLVSEKDGAISALQQQIDNNTFNNENLNQANEKLRELEQECLSLRNKSSHYDSLVNQFNELKGELTRKIAECDQLKAKVEELSIPPAKTINTKDKVLVKSVKEKKPPKIEEADDF